jgi:uncharacterized protein (TIGR02391 family)
VSLLTPRLASLVQPLFARGDYSKAVFLASKEVEMAVRSAGGFPMTAIGVNLMRDAFKETTGPLTDTTMPVPEQEARRELFSGAIGSYKNPGSHRQVSLNDPSRSYRVNLSREPHASDSRFPRSTVRNYGDYSINRYC